MLARDLLLPGQNAMMLRRASYSRLKRAVGMQSVQQSHIKCTVMRSAQHCFCSGILTPSPDTSAFCIIQAAAILCQTASCPLLSAHMRESCRPGSSQTRQNIGHSCPEKGTLTRFCCCARTRSSPPLDEHLDCAACTKHRLQPHEGRPWRCRMPPGRSLLRCKSHCGCSHQGHTDPHRCRSQSLPIVCL